MLSIVTMNTYIDTV